MNQRLFGLGLSLSILGWCLPSAATSTSLMNVETTDVARASGWIANVVVESVSQANASAPFIVVRARVIDVLKGFAQPGQVVSFHVPGGMANGKKVSVMGMPEFRVNRKYVVFLDQAPSTSTALSMSAPAAGLQNWTAYEVSKAANGAGEVVSRAGGLEYARSTQRGLSIQHGASRSKPLNDLYAEIFRGLD